MEFEGLKKTHKMISTKSVCVCREVAANGKPMLGSARTLRPPVLNMTGDRSPHVDATVQLNGRLQPNKCTWMKLQGILQTAQIACLF